jgi:hypothetical protein
MEIKGAMEIIEKLWPFSGNEYPGKITATGRHLEAEQNQQFAISHIILQFMKSAGGMAAIIVRHDQLGSHPAIDATIKTMAKKMVINSLRLASMLGITPDEIESFIRRD